MRDFIKDFLREKTEISPVKLNQKIKSVTVTSHPPNTNKQYLSSETLFNISGNKIDFKSYKAGKIVVWDKFSYDEGGKLSEVLVGKTKWSGGSYNLKDYTFCAQPIATIIEEEIVEVNERGQKVVSAFYATGKIKSRKLFNEKNICVEVNEFKNEALTSRDLYDANGQLLEARNFRSDGTPLNYTINTYNESSELSRSISVSRTGYVTYDTVLKYNEKGVLVEYIEHPIDPQITFADLKGASSGYSHRYAYTDAELLDTDSLYLCGELVMIYKYSYQLW